MTEQPHSVQRWEQFIGLRCGADGHYEILRRVGQGGMGVVFEGFDHTKQTSVALKVLKPDDNFADELKERFRREGSRFARLRHRNIVSVHGLGRVAGRLFIASEFIRGTNLHEYQVAHGPFKVDRALDVVSEIAAGLEFAHDHGVVHRDLKPENIMLTEASEVKILDFGIAKDLNATSTFTIPGTFIGTAGYSAPEQVNAEEVDGRADIFSLGVILYELITGRLAFSGSRTDEILDKTKDADPLKEPAAKDIDSPVAQLLAKMMRKKPRHRYANAGELIRAVEKTREWLRTSDVEHERSSLVGKLKKLFGL